MIAGDVTPPAAVRRDNFHHMMNAAHRCYQRSEAQTVVVDTALGGIHHDGVTEVGAR